MTPNEMFLAIRRAIKSNVSVEETIDEVRAIVGGQTERRKVVAMSHAETNALVVAFDDGTLWRLVFGRSATGWVQIPLPIEGSSNATK